MRPLLQQLPEVNGATSSTTPADYARWFRASTPYVSAHQGKTFVVGLSGEALASENCINVIHDLALVSVLGVRLVLVHGARPQISAALAAAGIESPIINGVRVTPLEALDEARRVCAGLRSQIEALFSQGLPHTPLHNTRISVLGGNLVTARPMGRVDGVNFAHTGVPRRIDTELIESLAGPGRIVLLSPFGYSPWGDLYNLESEQLAVKTAQALNADKLILFSEEDVLRDAKGQRISEIEASGMDSALQNLTCGDVTRVSLDRAAELSQASSIPTHLIGAAVDGALLQELFTSGGQGTRISQALGSRVRPAHARDIAAILAMIAPLVQQGQLKARRMEEIEQDLPNFLVTEVDGLVAGCCALKRFEGSKVVELHCLATHSNFRDTSAGDALLEAAIAKARQMGASRLFALTTQAEQWFRERGFAPAEAGGLPKEIKEQCQRRNSLALAKIL